MQQQDSTSHNPSHNSSAPLAIETAPSKGKGQAASLSTKSTKRKAIEGYGLYYSERTGSSFIQVSKWLMYTQSLCIIPIHQSNFNCFADWSKEKSSALWEVEV